MKLFGGLFLSVFLSLSAKAYDLSDHKAIMLQAMNEYSKCASALKLSNWNQFIVWQADMDEDLNLIRKEVLYSHFYNPYKKLDMYRYDSSVRVQRLREDLQKNVSKDSWDNYDNLAELGYLVHHLQDMTVPPHVVPIMHNSFSDGFEAYSFDGDISSGWSCQQISDESKATIPDDFLKDTALKTLENVKNIKIDVRMKFFLGDMVLHATGDDFWEESPYNEFGKYGHIGNHYGETDFVENGVHYIVPGNFYAQFKQGQMKLAVQSTLKALYWYASLVK